MCSTYIFKYSWKISIETAQARIKGDGHDLSKYQYLDWKTLSPFDLHEVGNSAQLCQSSPLPDTR